MKIEDPNMQDIMYVVSVRFLMYCIDYKRHKSTCTEIPIDEASLGVALIACARAGLIKLMIHFILILQLVATPAAWYIAEYDLSVVMHMHVINTTLVYLLMLQRSAVRVAKRKQPRQRRAEVA